MKTTINPSCAGDSMHSVNPARSKCRGDKQPTPSPVHIRANRCAPAVQESATSPSFSSVESGASIQTQKSKTKNSFDWPSITRSLIHFAQNQINRRRWRHLEGGVLPEGFDAESIAAEAILQFFIGRNANRWRNPSRMNYRLQRLVLRQVNRLYHLKENRLLSNEPDLARSYDFDGDPVSPTELVPDPGARPDQTAAASDDRVAQDALIATFRISLGRHRKLRACFDLLQDGDVNASFIASRLNLSLPKARKLKTRVLRLWNLHISRSSRRDEALISVKTEQHGSTSLQPKIAKPSKNREFHFAE
jgi:hypothetical protein